MTKHYSPLLRKISTIEDKSAKQFYVVFLYRTEKGAKRTIEVPRSETSDPRALEKRLLGEGAILPDKSERYSFISEAADSKSPRSFVRPAGSGWLNRRRTFVLQSRAIGKNDNSILGIGSAQNKDGRGRLGSVGTTTAWKKSVATLSESSSLLMFSIACGFASPLLDPCRQENFSICLSGPTRSGKSMATLVGGSVIGIRRKQKMLTWHGSEAGLEEQLPRFNDCLCPIDDFETLKGTDASKYQLIRNYSYGFSAGAEKTRHSSYPAPSDSWRSILLTSMEKPIRELARRVRENRQAGETLRMIDVPALLEGRTHIFDREEAKGVKVTQKWKTEKFRSIVVGCENAAGAVFEDFVARLCKKPNYVKKRAGNSISYFVSKVVRPDDGDIVHDIARKFGLIYAGGRLAISYKLVPWKQGDLLSAVRAYYEAARDLVPDQGRIVRDGKQLLIERLAAFKRKSELSAFDSEPGYQIRKKRRSKYWIKVEEFNAIFDSAEQANLVLDSLVENDQIERERPRTNKGRTGPKRQFEWPDGKRRRSYLITLPTKSVG